jgi:hypothetical protein
VDIEPSRFVLCGPSRVDSGNPVRAVAMTLTLPISTSTNESYSCILLHDLMHLIDRDLGQSEAASLNMPGMEQRLRANLVQDGKFLSDFPCLCCLRAECMRRQ